MQRMIYKKRLESDGEIVWMLNAYKAPDNKLKAIIMHSTDIIAYREMPYEEVKLSKLRPLPEDYAYVFKH